MNDPECISFLQAALPTLQMRWQGMRRVRKQVCKRINHRLQELQLADANSYLLFIEHHPSERQELKKLCRITITRFYRNKMVFRKLETELLPGLAQQLVNEQTQQVNIISIGCTSGEEPYTLAIIWQDCLADLYPNLKVNITALDIDHSLLKRAARACYPYSSIRNLPQPWRESCFKKHRDEYCLKTQYKADVSFIAADIFTDKIPGKQHFVLCRNLVFTYFTEEVQKQFLIRLVNSMQAPGFLITGVHEVLPDNNLFKPVNTRLGIYRMR